MGRYFANLAGRSGPLHAGQGSLPGGQVAEGPPEMSNVSYVQSTHSNTSANANTLANADVAEQMTAAAAESLDASEEAIEAAATVVRQERAQSATVAVKDLVGEKETAFPAAMKNRERPATTVVRAGKRSSRKRRRDAEPAHQKPNQERDPGDSVTRREIESLQGDENHEIRSNRREIAASQVPQRSTEPGVDAQTGYASHVTAHTESQPGQAGLEPAPTLRMASARQLPGRPKPRTTTRANQHASSSVNVRIGRIDVQVKPPKPSTLAPVRRKVSSPSAPPRDALRRSYLREF